MIMHNIKKFFGFNQENQSYNLQIVADNFVETITEQLIQGKTALQSLWQFENISQNDEDSVRGEKQYAGFNVIATITQLGDCSYEVVLVLSNDDDTIVEISGDIVKISNENTK